MPSPPLVTPSLIIASCIWLLSSACLPSQHISTAIFGARYRSHPVQVFSMGLGRLPDGHRQGPYLHLRLAVTNASAHGNVIIDPREQVLWLIGDVPVRPAYADCAGQSGVVTILPQRYKHLDLFYLVPEGVEEAVLAWTLSAADGTRSSERLAVIALPTRDKAAHLALWVPTGAGDGAYDVMLLEPWAAPTPSWHWWRDGDFPAWIGQGLALRASDGPAIEFGTEMWQWSEPASAPWVRPAASSLFLSPSVVDTAEAPTYTPERHPSGVTLAEPRSASSAQPRSVSSAWRRQIRPPPPPVRATPSRFSAESESTPSTQAEASDSAPSWRSADSAGVERREAESSASPVGRSWRSKR